MKLDERGKQCPLPVIETKKVLEASAPGETVEVIVDNEIAVQNLKKLATHKGCEFCFEKVNDREFVASIKVAASPAQNGAGSVGAAQGSVGQAMAQNDAGQAAADDFDLSQLEACPVPGVAEEAQAQPGVRIRKGMVAVLSSNQMGQGDEALGRLLMKGFVYALTQQDLLPEIVLLYNSGAFLSCTGSDNLEDLKELEARGVTILTCGTCLNHYNLAKELQVGGVTNMYEIVERMTSAGLLVRP